MLKEDILLEMRVRFSSASSHQYVCISKISSGGVFRGILLCVTQSTIIRLFFILVLHFQLLLGIVSSCWSSVPVPWNFALCMLFCCLPTGPWAKLSWPRTLIEISKAQTYAVPFRFPMRCFSFTWYPSSLWTGFSPCWELSAWVFWGWGSILVSGRKVCRLCAEMNDSQALKLEGEPVWSQSSPWCVRALKWEAPKSGNASYLCLFRDRWWLSASAGGMLPTICVGGIVWGKSLKP